MFLKLTPNIHESNPIFLNVKNIASMQEGSAFFEDITIIYTFDGRVINVYETVEEILAQKP